MHWAAHAGHSRCVEVVIQGRASVDALEYRGRKPVLLALVNRGSAAYAESSELWLPLDLIAEAIGHVNCAGDLKERLAPADVGDVVLGLDSTPQRLTVRTESRGGRDRFRLGW